MQKESDDMIVWGVNALNHGSSISVFRYNELISHSISDTDTLDRKEIFKCFHHGGPAKIYWYERPWIKKARQVYAGQYSTAADMSVLPRRYLDSISLGYSKLIYTPHHASHAAAGYYTSPLNDAAVVVLDAIGEFECASIWKAHESRLDKVWSRNYPNSLGLFYSAFTKLIGFTPIIEEYKLQQLSDHGDPKRYFHDVTKYFTGIVKSRNNLHRGVRDWPHPIISDQDRADIAAAVQTVFERQVDSVMDTARSLTGSSNLVYMGGCAMNSKYNRRLSSRWNKVWSLPNPGDPSSSIGAVLYHTKTKIKVNLGVAKHLEISV